MCMLQMKSLNSASVMGIGHCSALLAELTGRRSIVVLYFYFAQLDTTCCLECHGNSGHTLRSPIFSNLSKYASKVFSSSRILTYLLLAFYSRPFLPSSVDLFLAPLLSLILNTDLFLLMICINSFVPLSSWQFSLACLIRYCSFCSTFSDGSLPECMYASFSYKQSTSVWPTRWNTDTPNKAAIVPSLPFFVSVLIWSFVNVNILTQLLSYDKEYLVFVTAEEYEQYATDVCCW